MQYSRTLFFMISVILFFNYIIISKIKIKNKNKKIKILGFIEILLLGFFLGIRDFSVGFDTKAYVVAYNSISYNFKEPIYNFYMHLMKRIGFSSNSYILCTSILYCVVLTIALYKILDYKEKFLLIIWSLFLTPVFLFNTINILRQGLAGAILLLAVSYLKENSKSKKGKILLLLSPLIHTSTIIYLLLLVKKIEFFYKKLNYIWAIIITILGSMFLSGIVEISHKVLGYTGRYQSNSFYIKLIILIIVFLGNFSRKDKKMETYMIYITLIFILSTLKAPKLSNRYFYITDYFYPLLFFDNNNKLWKNSVYILIILFYQIYFLFSQAFTKEFNLGGI